MPNGGYPMQFFASISGSDLVLHAKASEVTVLRKLDTSSAPAKSGAGKYEQVGTLSTEQICGLLYHLKYWGGSLESDMFDRQQIAPQFHSTNCAYDY